jgi:hypothetical protein
MRPYLIAWIVQGAIVLLIPVGAAMFYFRHHADQLDRAMFLRRSGAILMAAFALFFGASIVGEIASDPGGWLGVGLIAAWLVPLLAFAALAWFEPARSLPVVGVLAVVAVSLSVWGLLDPDVDELENRIGPFTMIVLFGVAIVVGVLGYARPRAAGLMLVTIGVLPGLVAILAGPGPGRAALLVLAAPCVVVGALYLFSSRIPRQDPGRKRHYTEKPGASEPGAGPTPRGHRPHGANSGS